MSPDFRCKWDCIIVDSANFGTDMKTLIGKYRLITIDLLFERCLDDKCTNQTATFNSTRTALNWMWSTANFLNADQSGNNVKRFSKSLEGHKQAKVLCSLKVSEDVANNGTEPSINDLIATAMMEEVQRHSSSELLQSRAVLCYKESAENSSYVCVNTTTSAPGNNYVGWPVFVLKALVPLIWIVLMLFSPAVLCYFSHTKVYREGEWLIVLSGPCSHVSIRGWIANLCSPKTNSNFGRHKIAFLFILILGGALYAEDSISIFYSRKHSPRKIDLVTQPRVYLCICYSLWFLRALARICVRQLSPKEPCVVCYFCFGEKIIHQASEPLQVMIKQHMRIQPMIVIKCFRLLQVIISCYLQECRGILVCNCKAIFLYVLGVLFAPLVVVLSFVACLVLIVVFAFYSSPMSAFCDALMLPHLILTERMRSWKASPKTLVVFAVISGFLQMGIILGGQLSYLTLMLALGLITTVRTFVTTFPDELPKLTLYVIFAFYYVSYYSWFTKQYNNVAVYNYLLKKRTKPGEKVTGGKEKVIPKDLFDNVCEELMPLRDGLTILVVRIFALTTFILAFYAAIKEASSMTDKETDFVTAFATIIAGSVPYFAVMARQMGSPESREELNQQEFDEKLESIVSEYDKYEKSRTNNNAEENTSNTVETNNNAEENTSNTADNNNTSQERNERARLISNETEQVRSFGTFNRFSRLGIKHKNDNHNNNVV